MNWSPFFDGVIKYVKCDTEREKNTENYFLFLEANRPGFKNESSLGASIPYQTITTYQGPTFESLQHIFCSPTFVHLVACSTSAAASSLPKPNFWLNHFPAPFRLQPSSSGLVMRDVSTIICCTSRHVSFELKNGKQE